MVETRRQKAARNAIVISDTEDNEEDPEETKQPIPEYLAQRMQKGSHSMQQGDNERKSREGGPKDCPICSEILDTNDKTACVVSIWSYVLQ